MAEARVRWHHLGWLAILAAVQLTCGLAALRYSWLVAFAPVAAVLGAVAFVRPKVGLFILAATLYLRVDLPGLIGVYPGDLIALLVALGLVPHLLTHGAGRMGRTRLMLPMLLTLLVFGLSLFAAHDPALGLKNWLRHVQQFWIIIVTAIVLEPRDTRRLVRWLLFLSIVFAIPVVIEALRIDTARRVFGIASLFFPFYLCMGILYCVVAWLLDRAGGRRALWAAIAALLGLGVVATQTREAMLEIAIGVALCLILIWRWAGRQGDRQLRRRVAKMAIVAALVAILFLSGSLSYFEAPASRIQQALQGHSNTIFIRLFLWRTGIQAFLDAPVLGIGLGQIQAWDQFLPYWRFDPMAMVARGIGAHNDLITYAAETGVLGLAALAWLLWTIGRLGLPAFRQSADRRQLHDLLILWVPCLATIARFAFGTHTFYSLGGLYNCLYFGMLAAYVMGRAEPRTGTNDET